MSQLRSTDGFHDNRKVTPRYHENASYMNVIQDVATIAGSQWPIGQPVAMVTLLASVRSLSSGG